MSEYVEHFIREIEIKNFKLFKDFKAEGFGRVNLIGGKNNVGKAAFMEALFVNIHANNIKSFGKSLSFIESERNKMNDTNIDCDRREAIKHANNIVLHSNINNASLKIEKSDTTEDKVIFTINSDKTDITLFELCQKCNCELKKNINFINSFGLTDKDITKFYGQVEDNKEEESLNKILKAFDSSINSFQIRSTGELRCDVNNNWVELASLGDGTRYIISYFTALYNSSKGYLFLDEIENGIHYTNLDKLWEIILKISKEQNVQVFATTHSKECIESYARVAKTWTFCSFETVRMISHSLYRFV